jgi:hypothetical protein
LYPSVPSKAWSKKFVVDIEAVDDGRSVVAYLAPYVHRVAISDHRIQEVTRESVTYSYKPTKSTVMRSRTVIRHARSRKGPWHMAKTIASGVGLTNAWLQEQGLLSLKTLWASLARLR